MSKKTPTLEFYDLFNLAFEHFNETLFDGQLPRCLITVQRKKNTMGYFSKERWANGEGKVVHEIALNPTYFASFPLIEVMQTLVHEMCHLWQFTSGTPSRSGYHNKEWSNKMQSVGLMPTSTGQPGGKAVGQHMGDYPMEDMPFMAESEALVEKGFKIAWFDRHATKANKPSTPPKEDPDVPLDEVPEAPEMAEVLTPLTASQEILNATIADLMPEALAPVRKQKNTKSKYTCPGCRINLWGRPGVGIKCVRCDLIYVEHSS